jgi:hypothetical protein
MVVGLLGQRLIAEVAVEHRVTRPVRRRRLRRPRDGAQDQTHDERGSDQPQPRPTSKLAAFHLAILPGARRENPLGAALT